MICHRLIPRHKMQFPS
uniref:Uncharacterized protein n=1 Tax=Lutzomyia longipalpis TaxID=7200 RepID=A0A1B0C9C0_LUTLO